MGEIKLKTAILILGYRRPELLSRLLLQLDNLEVNRVYVSIDAAPAEDVQTAHKVQKCRDVAEEFVKNNPKRFLRTSNIHYGCRKGVISAIDWFFESEEEGIILEDDLKIGDSLPYIGDLLTSQFRNVPSVGSVSLYRAQSYEFIRNSKDVLISSPYPSSWGWITWRDRWKEFTSKETSEYGEMKKLQKYFMHGGFLGFRRWREVERRIRSGELDSWAYPWLFTHWLNGWHSIIVPRNMVENTGFHDWATHTKRGKSQPIAEPQSVTFRFDQLARVDKRAQRELLQEIYGIPPLTERFQMLLKGQ